MNVLPTRIGTLDLVRKLGSEGGTETYEGRRADGDRGRVLVRRVLPAVLAEPGAREAIETRVRDLMGVRHPFLVPVLDVLSTPDELLVVEQWVEAISTARIIAWCREHQASVPHNVFLNLSTQICNGIEALHGRPGKSSGSPNVLHMALRPSALFVSLDGRILLGGYGLGRAPALVPGPLEHTLTPQRAAYLSPEQADPEQKLIPASDIFSLASVLYELLTLDPLFSADSTAVTLQRLHRAEITTQLLGIKDLMPGLDKVLYRALSSSPRHRYQRAFVLREDLRGLMAGYSFASIADDTRRFLEPIVQSTPAEPAAPVVPGPDSGFEDDKASTRIDPDPASTAAFASQALAERILREQQGQQPQQRPAPSPAPMPQSFPAPRGPAPSSTAAWVAQAQGQPGASVDAPAAPGVSPAPAPRPAVAPAPQPAPAPRPAVAPAPVPRPAVTPAPAAVPFGSPVPSAPPPQADVQLAAKPAAPAPPPVSRSAALASAAPPPGGRSDSLAAAAPPPGRTAHPTAVPLPSPTPPPHSDTAGPPLHGAPPPVNDPEDDTGDWEPPRRRGGLMFMLVVGGLLLVLVCSGGLYAGWSYLASSLIQVPEDIAAFEVPDAPELPELPTAVEPPADDEGLDAVADVEPEEEQPPEDEQPAPAALPDEPTTARDRPAYTPPTATSTSGSSRSSSPSYSSHSSSGSSHSSSGSSRSSSPSYSSHSSSGSSHSSSGSSSSSSYSSHSSSSTPVYTPEPVAYDPDDGTADAASSSSESSDDSNSLLERYGAAAANGGLSSSDIMVVEMVQPEDPAYTRSRLMLVMNAKNKGDASAVKRYLDELSLRPENQYNPVVLAEYARYYVNKQDYQRALDKAVLAERHWARLPPELVFVKKAEIYEVEAAAYQGLFYRSEDNIELLDKSIRQWKKYREHVMTESRTDLQAHANREIEKLENIRERLQ